MCEGILSHPLDIKYLLEVNIAPSLDFMSIFHSFNDTCKYRPLYCDYSVLLLLVHLDTKTKTVNGNSINFNVVHPWVRPLQEPTYIILILAEYW